MNLHTRTRDNIASGRFGGDVAGSLLMHVTVVGLAVFAGWWYHAHAGANWGDNTSIAGAIPATMVDGLPLPPKPPSEQQSVLATETPSPAPVAPAPKTVEAPKPEAIPIAVKPTAPAKVAEKNTPAPPLHPQPVKVDPNKAQTGEVSSVSMPMASKQTQAGMISVAVPEAGFGSRFAYYVQQITQKVASQWITGMLDPRAAGHRVYITFQVDRDGSVSHIQIAQPSGDATLDNTALSAVQHIDTFAPLPDAYSGSHITVTYYFDPPPAH